MEQIFYGYFEDPSPEANVAKLAADSADTPGEAFLSGHTWLCKPCQDALRAVNVHTFHIVEAPRA